MRVKTMTEKFSRTIPFLKGLGISLPLETIEQLANLMSEDESDHYYAALEAQPPYVPNPNIQVEHMEDQEDPKSDPAKLELAKFAVSLPDFEWLPGTRGFDTQTGFRFRIQLRDEDDEGWTPPKTGTTRDIPDLDDSGTLGCMLELVRRKYKDPEAVVISARYANCPQVGWAVMADGRMVGSGDTEKEALVNALS